MSNRFSEQEAIGNWVSEGNPNCQELEDEQLDEVPRDDSRGGGSD
jgi:hypothetical protein